MIEIKNLSIICCGRRIVSGLSFTAAPCTITSIVGPSGIGKTTILKAMNRMLEERPEYSASGEVAFEGSPLPATNRGKYELRRKVGLVFQKPTIFPTSIFKNVIFGVRHIKHQPKAEFELLAERCLRDVGLWDEVRDRLHESALRLSIGQQQRLAIARTLAVGSEVLLMDEPTSSLDVAATTKIEELITALGKSKTIILVTHDMRQAQEVSHQIVRLIPSERGATATVYCDRSQFAAIADAMRGEPQRVAPIC